MRRSLAQRTALLAAIAVVVVTGARLSTRAAASDASDTTEAKIVRAMSAGPSEISRSARDRRGECPRRDSRSAGRVQRLYMYAGKPERHRRSGDVR